MTARDVERMVDQVLNPFDKACGVREVGVFLERRLVDPPRVDPEQPGIVHGTAGGDLDTARFLTRRSDDLAQRRLDRFLLPFPGADPRENEELHGSTLARTQQVPHGRGCRDLPLPSISLVIGIDTIEPIKVVDHDPRRLLQALF